MAECNEIISKIVLKDDDSEHEVSNADSALATGLETPCFPVIKE